jgi:hypothetical protein
VFLCASLCARARACVRGACVGACPCVSVCVWCRRLQLVSADTVEYPLAQWKQRNCEFTGTRMSAERGREQSGAERERQRERRGEWSGGWGSDAFTHARTFAKHTSSSLPDTHQVVGKLSNIFRNLLGDLTTACMLSDKCRSQGGCLPNGQCRLKTCSPGSYARRLPPSRWSSIRPCLPCPRCLRSSECRCAAAL